MGKRYTRRPVKKLFAEFVLIAGWWIWALSSLVAKRLAPLVGTETDSVPDELNDKFMRQDEI